MQNSDIKQFLEDLISKKDIKKELAQLAHEMSLEYEWECDFTELKSEREGGYEISKNSTFTMVSR